MQVIFYKHFICIYVTWTWKYFQIIINLFSAKIYVFRIEDFGVGFEENIAASETHEMIAIPGSSKGSLETSRESSSSVTM